MEKTLRISKRIKRLLVIIILYMLFIDKIYAFYSLDEVIEAVQEETGMTSQMEILGVEYKGTDTETVTIDVSKEWMDYGGGSYTEYIVGQKLMEWTFSMTDAKVLCILVEGEDVLWPEGSDYSFCTKEAYDLYYKVQTEDEKENP